MCMQEREAAEGEGGEGMTCLNAKGVPSRTDLGVLGCVQVVQAVHLASRGGVQGLH